MKLIVDMNEVCLAISEWLDKKGYEVDPGNIHPVIKTDKDGDYEETTITKTIVGFQVEI